MLEMETWGSMLLSTIESAVLEWKRNAEISTAIVLVELTPKLWNEKNMRVTTAIAIAVLVSKIVHSD